MKKFILTTAIFTMMSLSAFAGKTYEGDIISFKGVSKNYPENTCKLKVNRASGNNVVFDYVVNLKEPMYGKSGFYYLEFIDQDGFCLHKCFIGEYVGYFKGIIRGELTLPVGIVNKSINVDLFSYLTKD